MKQTNSTSLSPWQGLHHDWNQPATAPKTFTYRLTHEEVATIGRAIAEAMFQAEKRKVEVEERGSEISDPERAETQDLINVMMSLGDQRKEQERS